MPWLPGQVGGVVNEQAVDEHAPKTLKRGLEAVEDLLLNLPLRVIDRGELGDYAKSVGDAANDGFAFAVGGRGVEKVNAAGARLREDRRRVGFRHPARGVGNAVVESELNRAESELQRPRAAAAPVTRKMAETTLSCSASVRAKKSGMVSASS